LGCLKRPMFILDSLTESVRKEYKIPAFVVAFVTVDKIYYGISETNRIDSNQKATLKDKFHIGSNTKTITSFIAMKLVEENKISLNTKFFDLFKEIKSDENTWYHQITLGDLLSHNAQIPPYTTENELSKLPKFKGNVSDKRKLFSEFVLREEPVKRGIYSNAGYVLASLMLEKTTNNTYEELLKNIFSDLELSYFIGFPNRENIDNIRGHWVEFLKNEPLAPDHFYKLEDFMVSARDISMSILDYSKFIQLHLKRFVYRR